MVTEGRIETVSGGSVALRADTVCVHGDTPGAVEAARAVRGALQQAGVEVAPLHLLLRQP
jgi:UPF0271 protein